MSMRFLGFTAVALTLTTTFFAPSAHAADTFFCNDTFGAGDRAHLQVGFASGEEAAVKIVPDASAYPITLVNVFTFYGLNDDQNGSNESLNFYAEDDITGLPGTLLGSSVAPLVDSKDQINEVA